MTYSCVGLKNASACDCPVVIKCNCIKDKKIPSLERKFIYDQRTTRISFTVCLNNKETEKFLKRKKRKQQDSLQETVSADNDTCKMKITRKSPNERRDEIDLSLSPSASQMRSKLTSTALVIDRFGVSDRATAVIASSVLYDLGMISEKDTSLVIDKSRIRKEKQKTRQVIELAVRDPGPLSHSRWLTYANRVFACSFPKQTLQANSKCLLTTL
ncbi:hypothetical protein AVEN_120080-1 [Araneus ventricosus]|uniref:Uncharacterized protein n=1 Tax=Araneus ventricosus TaxID=182803 RepID=A0A4Y2G2Z0_ARAVE|nr:hypothetical protein AVEN_120080-1 [Araneus ventricosus]